MRYHWGLGIGHTYSHKDSEDINGQYFEADEDEDEVDGTGGNDSVPGGSGCSDDPERDGHILHVESDSLSESDSHPSTSGDATDRDVGLADSDEELLEITESYYAHY
jgi:hypothetical protein